MFIQNRYGLCFYPLIDFRGTNSQVQLSWDLECEDRVSLSTITNLDFVKGCKLPPIFAELC